MNDRIRKVQAELKASQIDCLAVVPGYNMSYLTGLEFHLMERATILFIPAEGLPVFALPKLEQGKVADIKEARHFTYEDGQSPALAVGPAVDALPEIKSLAVEFLRMRVMELTLAQQHLPDTQIVDAGPVIDKLRLRKNADEIAAMRMAVRITEKALKEVTGWLKPGMTERQIAGKLTTYMFELGGGVLPFEPLILAGAHAANPHGTSDDTVIKEGEALLFDFGTSYGGYVSDITRCFAIGRPLEGKARDVYEAVKAANAAGRAAAGPGVPCQEVDRAARKVINEAGFGEYFFHRVGHGIGLEGHEGPYMVEGNTLLLEEGMCFTVEPGIYIPGEIGVRVEDDLVITASGAESLTTFNRDLTVIGG